MEETRPQTAQINFAYATKAELEELISSKDHFIQLFTVQGRYLLPPKQYISWRWISEILNGTKVLLPLSRVPCLYLPPKVSELTVKNLYEQVKDDDRISRFFPTTNRPQDKRYFFAILAAILPDFFETALTHIKENRKTMIPETQKIAVTPEMQALITRNTAYIGPKAKVGQYLNTGRQWTTPVRTTKPALELRRLF